MWRQLIRTNINATTQHGRRTIGVARPDGSVLMAGASSHARRHRPSLASLAGFDVMAPYSKHNRNRSGRNSLLILQHPSQSRWISSSRRRTTRDADMRECKTIEELSQSAHDHLDVLSPRGKSAFWTILSKLLQKRGGGPPRTNLRHGQIKEQLDTILCNTLQNMEAFEFRDIATTALGLAKIVKQVGPFRGKKPPSGSPHQILHDLLIGVNSENKQFIFGQIAMFSIPVLSDSETRSLSNFIYAYGLAECFPNVEGGRTLFDVVAVEATSKLTHFNSQDLSNMLWAYANVGASNSALFNAAGDSVISLEDLSEFIPQHVSNIVWAYATAVESHPQLFKQLADHIVSQGDLNGFNSQALSNILWAYATAGESHPRLFKKVAIHIVALNDLNGFKPQAVSNIVWAYATADESHSQLFKQLADHIVAQGDLSGFNPQALSNILWAYATAGESHPRLFKKLTDHIVTLRDLNGFNPQNIANILWAYATAGESPPQIFEQLADHIVAQGNLSGFNPQALSNIIWAYVTAGESHPQLFKQLADHIVAQGDLNGFNSQAFSTILWAYATAGKSHPRLFNKLSDHIVNLGNLSGFDSQSVANMLWAYASAGESSPQLFQKFANHIVAQGDLSEFKPQEISNILWAYATAGESHPKLFTKLADYIVAQGDLNAFKPQHEAIARCSEFNPQEVSNIVWACATAGESHPLLFQKLADVAITRRNDFNPQGVSNLLWAYAVVNVDVPSIFNADFIGVFLKKENDISLKCFSQLHQWQLWQKELKSGIRLPPSLRKKSREAFLSQLANPSRLQDDVISVLASIGLQPEEEVLTKSGYRMDALVEANGKKIGIEVDGPSHFVGRKPTGSTLLKRRQVNTLDAIEVISVPYWEWDKLGNNVAKKQQYLRFALGLS